MGLFGRPREQLIEGYRNRAEVVASNDALPLTSADAEPRNFRPERLRFELMPRAVDGSSLRTVCFAERVNPALFAGTPLTTGVELPLSSVREIPLFSTDDTRSRVVALLSRAGLVSRTVDLASFKVVVKRFSFPGTRAERTSLFDVPCVSSSRTANRVPPVGKPEPPPSLPGAGLEERLKWILTPPIHEVLSDPQLALPDLPFPFQATGIKWLYDRDCALLADEMGLGKSMQAILAARLLWRDKRLNQVLVVAPKSLLPNWRKELSHWWPGVDAYTREVEGDRQDFLRLGPQFATVKLINYEAVQRELAWLKDHEVYHDLVILDEAQRVKNPGAQVSNNAALHAARGRTSFACEEDYDKAIMYYDEAIRLGAREQRNGPPYTYSQISDWAASFARVGLFDVAIRYQLIAINLLHNRGRSKEVVRRVAEDALARYTRGNK